MRVLYLHQHFNSPDGMGGTRSYEFARALVSRGHAVTMVCGRYGSSKLDLPVAPGHPWARGDIDGIDVIALPLNYSNNDSLARRTRLFLQFAWNGIQIALRHQPHDALFATSTPLTAGLPGIVSKLLLRRVPFVFEVRDLWPELPRAMGMKNPFLLTGMSVLEWLSYRCADACVGLSPGIVEGIRRRSPPQLPVAMIPNACDLDLFHPSLRGPLGIPGIDPGDFVAGFIGAHGLANGLDAILDAAAELKRRGRTHIKMLLVGQGSEKKRLVERAQAEGLSNCLFLPPVPKKEIARLTASLGCGLMVLADVPAFYRGTSPNKFFDYLSSGLPVINNYPGWIADMIRDNNCGIAVQPRDPVAFANALETLAGDPSLCRDCGKNARRLGEVEFSRADMANRFVDCLETVHAHRARPGMAPFE